MQWRGCNWGLCDRNPSTFVAEHEQARPCSGECQDKRVATQSFYIYRVANGHKNLNALVWLRMCVKDK